MEQLSEDILKRRPEKAVSDDEKILYAKLVSIFSHCQQGSQEFWDLIISKLSIAVQKA